MLDYFLATTADPRFCKKDENVLFFLESSVSDLAEKNIEPVDCRILPYH